MSEKTKTTFQKNPKKAGWFSKTGRGGKKPPTKKEVHQAFAVGQGDLIASILSAYWKATANPSKGKDVAAVALDIFG